MARIFTKFRYYLTHPQAIIPGLFSNRLVCGVIDLLLRHPTKAGVIEENAVYNRKQLEKAPFYTKGAFIENQGVKSTPTVPGWDAVHFSNGVRQHKGQTYRSSMNYSGCELTPCYNALLVLEAHKEAPEIDLVPIISYFEKDGAVWKGLGGTSARAMVRFFRQRGYLSVITYSKDPISVHQLLKEYDVVIITVYNSARDIRSMIHTMCVTKEKDDAGAIRSIRLHNCSHRNTAGKYIYAEYRDMEALMAGYKAGGAKLLCTVGIRRS